MTSIIWPLDKSICVSQYPWWTVWSEQSFTTQIPLVTATSTFRFGRKRKCSPQWCYLHCLRTTHGCKISYISITSIKRKLIVLHFIFFWSK